MFQNHGVTSTLYNVGGSAQRAAALAQKNRQRAAGEQPLLPEENYYGWLVNDRIKDLQALL